MSHFLNRSNPKSPVAGVSVPTMIKDRIVSQHLGTTREPRPRALKHPTG